MNKIALVLSLGAATMLLGPALADEFRVATFSADVTIPIGHRCMGVLPQKAKEIVDPLEARGFVITARNAQPVVFVSVDWCEIRNGAYERWRDVLAAAAGTVRERVFVTSVHQHDAPVVDLGAEKLLAEVGLGGELCDAAFHERALQRVAGSLRTGSRSARPVTHFGVGKARVERIASSRRVVGKNGSITYDRGSASGGNANFAAAPEGRIDPWLRTLSFWSGDEALVAVHTYATHPMSYYGRGGVSADFVGMARRTLQREFPGVFQIYASGASGDVTAGKYNDGSTKLRPELAARLAAAMRSSWSSTKRHSLEAVKFRNAKLALEFHEAEEFTGSALERVLRDERTPTRERILAAMGLASRRRLDRPIDVPCLDFGAAAVVLLPGEVFVGHQLRAQAMRRDSEVLCIGYGECWPGYVPTAAAFDDGFGHDWRWVTRGSEQRISLALREALAAQTSKSEEDDDAVGQTIWDPATAIPPAEDIPRLERVTFHVIQARRPDIDGYEWLHGVALAWHDGHLYASFGHNKGAENTATEVAHSRRSKDGGATWEPIVPIDRGTEELAVSHGVFLSHEGTLWALMGAFHGKRQNVHTRAYTLGASGASWTPRGIVIREGFWPMQEPYRMKDGHWIIAGFRVDASAGNPAAVAVSESGEFAQQRWRVVTIPKPPSLRMWGESTVLEPGPELLCIARYSKPFALVATSRDFGRTWTRVRETRVPMAASKPYAGVLSTGHRYLIGTIAEDSKNRRHPLTIAIGEPDDEPGFSKLYRIRDAIGEGPGESHPNAALAYPYAVERDGKLYIGYSNSGGRGGNRNSGEMAIVPIGALIGSKGER